MNPWANLQFIVSVILLAVFVVVAILGDLQRRRKRLAVDAHMDPYCKGDFKAALQGTEKLKYDPRAYCFYRGATLLQLGDLKEAETLLLQNIALAEQALLSFRGKGSRNLIKLAAISRQALGETHLEQRRYDDALRCFEASLRDWPDRGSSHRAIAEAWLRRGNAPTEALKWARLAVEEDRASTDLTQEARDTNLGEDLATLAWAVAVASHDGSEVDRLVTEAVTVAGTVLVTTSAQVQYHSGLAYEALGNTERSAQHFNEAVRIDSQGRWGRAARAAVALIVR
jgi:tetratricopeptide (TPR) repeat protein